MNIQFFIPVYRRLKVTELCYQGLRRILSHIGDRATCRVLVCGSEPEHEALARRYSWDYIHQDNEPLGRKMNGGIEHALGQEFDYLFQLNSDDLLSNELADIFLEFAEKSEPFFSVERLYFYHPATNQAKKFRYFDGCGVKGIRRDILEKAGWCHKVQVVRAFAGMFYNSKAVEQRWNNYVPVALLSSHVRALSQKRVFNLYPDHINRGLDYAAGDKLRSVTGGYMRLPMPIDPLFVDIKTDENIWPYDSLTGGEEATEADWARMRRIFPELNEAMQL